MKKGIRITALGLTVMAISAAAFQTSGAAGLVSTETSIAGASFALDEYNVNTATHDAVLALLFGEEEAETETEIETETETETETESETAAQTLYALASSGNYVRVRSTPTTADDSNIVGKMYDGSIATIIESVEGEDGIWYHITSGSVEGYVKSDFFITGTADDEAIANAFTSIGTVYNTTGLYVRSGPSVETEAITLLSAGTQLAIIGEEGDFYQIQLDETCVGYVHKDYIDVVKTASYAISMTEERLLAEAAAEAAEAEAAAQAEAEAEAQAQAEAEAAAAEAEAAAAREAAEAQAAAEAAAQAAAAAETTAETASVVAVGVQASYNGGTKYVGNTVSAAELTVLGVFSDGSSYAVDGWGCDQVGVALAEGTNTFTVTYQGFECSFTVEAVAQAEAVTDANSELRASIVNYALQFVGNPYVYGGTSLVNGCDCSGFTSSIYAAFGYSITRTSRSQAAAGTEIALSDVQPGDLVFYTNVSTGVIGHVAMYIGNGQIVHAASETLGIIVSDMYYRQPCKAVTFLN